MKGSAENIEEIGERRETFEAKRRRRNHHSKRDRNDARRKTETAVLGKSGETSLVRLPPSKAFSTPFRHLSFGPSPQVHQQTTILELRCMLR